MKNRSKWHTFACLLALAVFWSNGAVSEAADKVADTTYWNGRIYTVTETMEEARDASNAKTVDVVAAKDGVIVFAGSRAEAQAKGYLDSARVGRIVDLRGKYMYPGFVDGHSHFQEQGGLDLYQVDLNSPPLGKLNTIDEYITALRKKAETTPAGEWICGWGYDDSLVAEKRHPTRQDLDRASTEHPIWVKHVSGHMGVANSKALEMCGVTSATAVEGVVKDANGEPTGLLLEAQAYSLVMSPAQAGLHMDTLKAIARSNQLYAAAGFTTADDGGASIAEHVPAFQKALQQNLLNVRIMVHPMGYYGVEVQPGYYMDFAGWPNRATLGWKSSAGTAYDDFSGALPIGTDITSLDVSVFDMATGAKTTELPAPENLPPNYLFLSAWKIIFDGSPQGYTAWLKNPGYYDWGSYAPADSFDPEAKNFIGLPGTVNFPPDTLKQQVKFYHRAGQGVEVHTNGSAGAEALVSAIEEAVAAYPDVVDTRHTSIHGQMMERQHIERLVGRYDHLAETADMYTDLDGIMKGGVFDDTLGGKIGSGRLGPLMAAQNNFNSYFDNHVFFWGDRHMDIFMGPGRAKNMSPAGWSDAYGQRYSFHNDTYVTPISALRSIQSAVSRLSYGNRLISGQGKDLNAKAWYQPNKHVSEKVAFWDYDQRLNPLQALHAVTIYPAYQNKLENRIGTLEVGKLADFLIMDEDILQVAANEPLRVSDMRVASTIVGDKVVHGILPDADTYLGQFFPSYDQAEDVSAQVTDWSVLDPATAEKEYAALPQGMKRLGTIAFTATVTPEKVVVFQFNFLGNGATVAEHALYKLQANTTHPYVYGRPGMGETASGQWWIADLTAPTVALDSSAILEKDKTYIAFFSILDNDAIFDQDATSGVIVDPVSLATSGVLPANGGTGDATGSNHGDGSGSGCTVSQGAPAYDLLVLLLACLGVVAFRSRKLSRRGVN